MVAYPDNEEEKNDISGFVNFLTISLPTSEEINDDLTIGLITEEEAQAQLSRLQ